MALDFQQGTVYEGVNLRACEQNGDWFSFATPGPGWTANVTVSFVHEEGDLDAQLFAPDDRVVRAESADDDETLTLNGPEGTWYLYVYSRGFDRNDYDLRVELEPSSGPSSVSKSPAFHPHRAHGDHRQRPDE